MDIYDNNPSIGFLKPEMRNMYWWLWRTSSSFRRRHPNVDAIRHANVIDIFPDPERVRTIAANVQSIECMVDQLADVKRAQMLTVNVPAVYAEPTDGMLVDNTHTKVIYVVGNVQNIRLTVDDEDTVVYHRTFAYSDQCGLVIGDNYNDDGSLKPRYYRASHDMTCPAVFDIVRKHGIGFVDDADKTSFQNGDGWLYLLHPSSALNVLKGARIVAIRNNSAFDPEVENMRNTLIVHGQPTSFRNQDEGVKNNDRVRRDGDVLMADMSTDAVRSFLFDDHVGGYDYKPKVIDGFSTAIDYNLGISPARRILMKAGLEPEVVDELSFKIDNPFTFAYVKRRRPENYRLLMYAVLRNPEITSEGNMATAKLKIVYASEREKTIDAFSRDRFLAIRKSSAPEWPFIRERPRIDPFSERRMAIVRQADDMTKTHASQRKNFVIRGGGKYSFTDLYNVYIWNEGGRPDDDVAVDLYIANCGKVFVHNREKSLTCRIHVVGKVHTLMCSSSCGVVCYCVHEQDAFTDYLVYSDETEDIGMFVDTDDDTLFNDFTGSRTPGLAQVNETPSTVLPSKFSTTRIRCLFANKDRMKGHSLAIIGRYMQ